MTARIEIVDIPPAWQVAVAILWLDAVSDRTASGLSEGSLEDHFRACLTDRGDNMLHDEIYCVRRALEAALAHDSPAIARAMVMGAVARLEVLEAEAHEWQESAVIAPEKRFDAGPGAASNVVPLRRPCPEGGAA